MSPGAPRGYDEMIRDLSAKARLLRVQSLKLGTRDKFVLLTIAIEFDSRGGEIGQAEIEKRTGIARRTVRASVERLENAGLLDVMPGDGRSPAAYLVNFAGNDPMSVKDFLQSKTRKEFWGLAGFSKSQIRGPFTRRRKARDARALRRDRHLPDDLRDDSSPFGSPKIDESSPF